MSNNKRIAKNTLYLYIRTGLMILITLLASSLLLDALGSVDFGLYFLIAGFVILLGFLKSSLTSGVRRFIAYELGRNNQSQLKRTFSMAVNIHLIATVMFLVIGETIGLNLVLNELTIPNERVHAVLWVYQASLIGFCFTLITLPHLALILAHEDIKVFATVTLIESTLKLAITYSLTWVDYDRLVVYSVLIFILNFLISAYYFIYSKRAYPEITYSYIWDRKLFKSISSFSAYEIIGNLSAVMSNQGANILINLFFGPVLNTAKAIASQVDGATKSFSNNFMLALTPPIVKSFSAGNYSYTRKLVFKGCRYSFYLMMLVTFSLYNNLIPVFDLWLGDYPPESIAFTQVILMISLLSAIGRPLSALAQATGNIRAYQVVVGGTLLTSIPVAFLLLSYGMGAIWTFYTILIINVLAFIVRIIMLRRIFDFSISYYILTVLCPIISVSIISFFLTNYLNLNYYFIVNILLDFMVTVTAIVVIGLSKTERLYILNKCKTFVNF